MRPPSRPRLSSATAVSVVALAILVAIPSRGRAATQELSCSPASLVYGNVAVGQTETLLVAVINHGRSSVTVSSVSTSNSGFEVSNLKLPQVVAAGERFAVSVTFAPAVTGQTSGQVTFISNAPNPPLTLGVSGAGVTSQSVTANPASVSFGNVYVGATSTLPVVLTNTRSRKVTLASLHTVNSAFSVSGATFPLTLAAGQSVSLDVTFKPQAAGLIFGRSFIFGPAINIPLTGTGARKPQLAINPAPLDFGDVAVGGTETLTVELSASGGSVTISSISSSGSQFAVTDATFPLIVPEGHEVSLDIAFAPQQSGTQWAKLSFSSDAAYSPMLEGLTGTGTVPYVSLSWNASTSPGVAGYNVYRKTYATGSYVRVNPSLDPDTSYTDTTVAGRTTYYYATTAVTSKGKESGYSNRVKVVVP
jgi:hypothetical protein